MGRVHIFAAFCIFSIAGAMPGPEHEIRGSPTAQPNIVYILGDDLGWNDIGIHNAKVLTPNLNKLAAQGIELTNSYAQPICSNSRSSLMTGRYPITNGFQHLILNDQGTSCLPLDLTTLPEYMREAGYVTKMVGKWHLGLCNEECLPLQRGFDEYRGILGSEASYWTWSDKGVMHKFTNNSPETKNLGKTHLTIQDRTDARDMILAHKGSTKPLFMVVAPNAPHSPLEPTESMYNVHDFLDPNDPDSNNRRKYLGLVSALDDLVGDTILALQDAGLSENTIVIYQSDNGGATVSPPLLESKLPGYGNNYPLRNGKMSYFEGGVKVNTIYYDPRLDKSTRGTTRDFLMHIADWTPTFLELAKISTDNYLDGLSQVANLGPTYNPIDRYAVRDRMVVNIDTISGIEALAECTDRDIAFRWDDWKLIHGRRSTYSYREFLKDEHPKPVESPELPNITSDSCVKFTEDGEMEIKCLFNLRDDPYETTDLYDVRPGIVEYMLEMVEEAKKTMVKYVYTSSIGVNSNTTEMYDGNILVPRTDFCDPADFPLEKNDPSCFCQDKISIEVQQAEESRCPTSQDQFFHSKKN